MSRLINIMPMAGLGKRFSDLKYKQPKPFIDINGIPMFIAASRSMPDSSMNIFICNKEIVNINNVKNNLEYFGIKNYSIISTENIYRRTS